LTSLFSHTSLRFSHGGLYDWIGSDSLSVSFYTVTVSDLCISYPWGWAHCWPKHVAVHCQYYL